MAKLADDIMIRGNRVKNRIAMAPMVTFSFRGDNGSYYGRQHIEHYTDRAKGGAGLIILQATRVLGAAQATDMWSADNRRVLRQIAGNCHDYGAVVMMQLSCGDMDINQLSIDDIQAMQADMKQAALAACDMGFDGVEYHFAHGYTLCKFIDASYNQRTDCYGGNALNRTRILADLLPDIRSSVHDRFIVSVRMGAYLPESRQGIETARAFESAGVDLLHISFGMKPPATPVPDGFICSPTTYSGYIIKKEVHIPVIAVNEIRTAEQVRFLLDNDYADVVAIGRGMFTDPAFANHVLQGEPVNKCFGCGGTIPDCRWFTDHTLCPGNRLKTS